jgi:hypothetical protein
MIYKTGDLLDSGGYVFQQVNCQFVMGKGLALQIRSRYPEVYTEYKKLQNKDIDNASYLGTYQTVKVADKTFVNVFSQEYYGRGPLTEYPMMIKAFEQFKQNEPDGEYNFPYLFGCGLAGGDWNIVSGIIDDYFPDAVIWKLPNVYGT